MPVPEAVIDFSVVEKEAVRDGFTRKHEFHMTVLGKAASEVLAAARPSIGADGQPDFVADVQKLVDAADWSFQMLPEWYWLQRDKTTNIDGSDVAVHKETFVQVADIPGLPSFYRALNESFSTNISAQFPHVTLYVKISDPRVAKQGISINSKEDFLALRPRRVGV